ncbi:MAG: S9 family peptidase [Phycisphaera sp.]|nr:MAG: S9 family peptidase [Phycisphaera sp.]
MKQAIIALLLFCALPSFSQPGDDTHGITLEKIMSDPDWIGLFPERSYWSDDGGSVMFYRDQPGKDIENLVELDLETNQERVVGDAERSAMAQTRWGYNRARTMRVCSRGGDLFLDDIAAGDTVRLTRTTQSESSPFFVSGSRAIGYVSGGNWYVLSLDDASLRQLADIRFEDEPNDEDDDEGYLDEQQERLFSTIAERRQRDQDREELRDRVREANESDVPGPFYLGKGIERRSHAVSDDGRFIAVVASKPWPDAERDTMPAYVTEDGYVSSSRVRHKVGVRDAPAERLFLVDTVGESWSEIDLSGLPGVTDDPLAFLREQKSDEAENAEDETELKPRAMGLSWLAFRPGSHTLVFQARSRDNKDRWIVSVVPGEDEAVAESVFRESTDGWINWRSTAGSWASDGSVYWFLSETSGYSHIHAYDGSSVRQVTSGEHEYWDVAETTAPGILCARTNSPDPSIYEVARISLIDDSVELLTEFGSVVERFRISPDGNDLLLEVSTNDHPSELFVQKMDPLAEPRRLTRSVTDAFARMPWIEPEYVDIPTRNGNTIRGRIYSFDSGGSEETKPAVIFVHGAGYTQNIDRGWPYYFREMMFHSMLAYKGYVVADIDFRASAGYGREFREAIYRHMGGPEIEDMVDTADWLAGTYSVDPTRVGTYGGSYGGFLAIMAVFKEPSAFNAAAALRPVTDWAHYNHGYTSNILNTPEFDPEAYERSSPIEFAEGFEGGLLICHGMLDDNVLVQDTIRLQQRLIELEKQDWEVALYPMEGHGFVEPSAWLDEYRRIFKLFETRLRTHKE